MNSLKNNKKMKILSTLLLVLILLQICMPLISKASDLSVKLTTTATEIKAGETVNVNIYVTGGKTAYFEAYLEYDKDIFETLTRSDISVNSKLLIDEDYGIWSKTLENTSDTQKISISESQGTPYEIPDDGLLATIKFKVKMDTDTSTIKFNSTALVNDNNKDLEIGDISVNVPAGSEKKYTITYNPNTQDVVENMTLSGIKIEGTDFLIADAPTRTGYIFTGWNTSSDGEGTNYEAGSTYSDNADLNLYAQWQIISSTLSVNPNGGEWEGKTNTQTFTGDYGTTKEINNPTQRPNGYVVRFNSNGGLTLNQITQTKSFSNWEVNGGGELNGTTYTFADIAGVLTAQYTGDEITLPETTKTGAIFKGWYTEISGGKWIGGSGDKYLPTENTVLFAQWEDINYTLTINPNGGELNGSTEEQKVEGIYNSTTEVGTPTAPKGYTVTLKNNDGTETTNTIEQTQNFEKWSKTDGTDLEGTTYTFGTKDETITAVYTRNAVELTEPTREGYTFAGWYTEENEGTKVESEYMPEGDVTLYAHWTANKYTITLNPGEGTLENNTKEVTYGEAYGELPTPTREGYNFEGWYDTNENKIEATDIVDILENLTLNAKWSGIKYTITFDSGEDATLENNTKEVTYGETYGELPTPTKTGYTFAGWYKDEEKIESTTSVNVIVNTTLTAKWEIIKSTLTVNPNGGIWEGETTEQTYTQDYGTTQEINNPSQEPKGYTVTFNAEEGSTEEAEIIQTTTFKDWTLTNGGKFEEGTYTYGETEGTLTANYTKEKITLPSASKIGATFKGWYTEETDGIRVGGAEDEYLPENDVTLYAQWENINYTLTIDPNGGELNESTEKQKVEGVYNSTTEVGTPTAPKGYTVTLKNNDGTETTNTIEQTQNFEKWSKTDGTDLEGTTYTFGTKDETITAVYTRNAVELTEPTREGYTFAGWYTEENEGTKVESEYMPEGDVTLYAHWTANKYTITLNPGEGTLENNTKEVTYGEAYGELPTPTREGYNFEGWYDTNENKIEATDIVDILENLTLNAKWSGIKYTITFDSGEDATLENNTKEVTYGETYGELPTPTKTGYTFAGWYKDEEKIESTTTVNLISDIILTAKWEIVQSTLTVDPNGGTWEEQTIAQTFTQDYKSTKTISAPTQGPNGYTVTFDTNGGTSTEELRQIQTTKFKKWNLVGGGGSINNNVYTYGIDNGTILAEYSGNAMKLPTVTKVGSKFKGWYTSATDGVRRGGAGEYFTPTATETLYAQWEEEEYTLTIIPNGGTWNGSVLNQTLKGTYHSTQTVENPIAPNGYMVTLNNDGNLTNILQTQTFSGWTNYGNGNIIGTTYTFGTEDGAITAAYEKNKIELPVPTKEGYTFAGWYTKENEGTKVESEYMPEGDVTLYAHWTANKYTITLNPGEGTLENNTKEVIYGEKYGELPTPTREGYDFEGWYDKNENKIESTDIVDIVENSTLIAKWVGTEYTITFDAGEGTTDIASKQVKNGQEYGELPDATRTGYTFIGWYNSENEKIENTTIAEITSNITLTAKYKINKYTVTFLNDDGRTPIKVLEAEYGTDVVYSGETPEKMDVPNGYNAQFTGWDNLSKLQNITQDISVIATYQLTPISYTIEYKNLKESDNFSNPTTYTVEDKKIDLVNLSNQDKYIFKGWYTTADENGEKVTSIDTSKMENIVLYAQWEEDKLYLKSEKYKIGENNIDIYEKDDMYLDKIEPETTVKELKNNCETNGTIEVLDEKNEVLSDDELVGTNMTIQVTRKNEKITLTAVVMGDLDGNGKVTATDLSALNQAFLKIIKLEDAAFKAADLDDNNKLSATDLSTINNTILKNIILTYDKK